MSDETRKIEEEVQKHYEGLRDEQHQAGLKAREEREPNEGESVEEYYNRVSSVPGIFSVGIGAKELVPQYVKDQAESAKAERTKEEGSDDQQSSGEPDLTQQTVEPTEAHQIVGVDENQVPEHAENADQAIPAPQEEHQGEEAIEPVNEPQQATLNPEDHEGDWGEGAE